MSLFAMGHMRVRKAPTRSYRDRMGAIPCADLDRLKAALAAPIMVDLRNIYQPEDMIGRGLCTRASAGQVSRAEPPRPGFRPGDPAEASLNITNGSLGSI